MKGFPGLGLRRSNETAMRGFAVFDKTKTPKRIVVATAAMSTQSSATATCRPRRSCDVPDEQLPPGDASEPPRPGRGARPPRALCQKGRMLVSPMLRGKV